MYCRSNHGETGIRHIFSEKLQDQVPFFRFDNSRIFFTGINCHLWRRIPFHRLNLRCRLPVVVGAGSDFPQDTDRRPADINKTPISNPDRNFRAMNMLLLQLIFFSQILTYLYVPFNNDRKNREGAGRTLKRFLSLRTGRAPSSVGPLSSWGTT